MPTLDELIALKRRVEDRFLGQRGVTAVDVGYKEVGGERTGQVAIRVHVSRKRDDVTEDQRVPLHIDDAVTDVLERTYELQVLAEPVGGAGGLPAPGATLQGGVGMGPARTIGGREFAGTLGAIVIDNGTRERAALTNWHVACVDNAFTIGDRMVQPSLVDGGIAPGAEFGSLLREVLSADVDGALISIDAGRSSSCDVLDIGRTRGARPAVLGMAVRKRGRTTGLTYGIVEGLDLTLRLDYGYGVGIRTLRSQLAIGSDILRNGAFSQRGDSGAVVVDENGDVVGLLFAAGGLTSTANRIDFVLGALDVSICSAGG